MENKEKIKKLTKKEKKELKAYKKANNIPSLWDYIKVFKTQLILYIVCVVIGIVMSLLATVMFADAVAEAIEAVSSGVNSLYLTAIIKFLIACVALVVGKVDYIIQMLIYNKVSTQASSNMSIDLAYQAFKFNASTYSNNSTGTFVQRILHDPTRIINQLVDLVESIESVITSLVIVIYIFVLNWIVGLILLVGMVISFVIERVRIKLRTRNMKEINKKFDKINSLTTEIVKSERDIKSLGLEEQLRQTTDDNYNSYHKSRYKMFVQNSTLGQTRGMVNNIFAGLSLIVGVILLERSLLTAAAFSLISSNRSSWSNMIREISAILDIKNDITIFSERIFALYDNKKFPHEHFGDVELKEVKGAIQFKDVSYAYDDKLNTKNNFENDDENETVKRDNVVEHLSFSIKPNTTVAFVGKSGSGKSTILSLMSKMYEVDDGEILIDNVNINDLTKDSLRKNISLVNQFPYIFDVSIKDNLLLVKRDATDEELDTAIKNSYLKEFIDELPDGIDTIVGESGIKLSGGQRQRLAIARAFLRKTPIILFDESTSSLDNFAQEHIKQSIDNLKGTSTIVIVAHRLSTIKNVDKIFFLDEGKIVDSGTFEQLFKNNKKFHNMFLAENID